ncbi:MAG: DUF4258 domain-containing protein [Saprospiraceae bacterium]
MQCENIEISRHALKKSLDRDLNLVDAIEVVQHGEIIIKYTDTKPHPCYLILGFPNDQPLHVVVAKDIVTEECWLVTLYFPDISIWNYDFKTRKN